MSNLFGPLGFLTPHLARCDSVSWLAIPDLGKSELELFRFYLVQARHLPYHRRR